MTRLVPALLLLLTACSASPATPASPASSPPPPITAPVTTTVAVTTVVATVPPPATTPPAPLLGLSLETVGEGFDQPILLLSRPDDGARLVMERRGVVKTLDDQEVWFDISERVNSEDGIEPGLLGMAFHPAYPTDPRFFVFYYRSDAEKTRLAQFQVNAGVVDLDSETTLLEIDKPTNRHNGGMLQFGPDGYLYLSTGEGGKASLNAQNPDTLLGKMLRVDVDGGHLYQIPPDNPYVGGGGAPEVIAYGLRNPWRTWIDPVERIIYIADVGQEAWEEVSAVGLDSLAGTNFGWLRMEGSSCFQPGCDALAEGLTLPVVEYPHDDGCSVTGGVVYRGSRIPEIEGRYFYADWCAGWVRSFRLMDGVATDQRTDFKNAGQINGFGVDAGGEMYLLTFAGEVKQVVALRGE